MNAFKSEITIGTSAPPTGSTKSTPKSSERSANSSSRKFPPCPITNPALTKIPINVPAITKRPPGNITGLVVINSCNFKKVTTDPLKDIQPTITVNTVAITASVVALSPKFKYSTIATSAAAPPPTPLNSATICGI